MAPRVTARVDDTYPQVRTKAREKHGVDIGRLTRLQRQYAVSKQKGVVQGPSCLDQSHQSRQEQQRQQNSLALWRHGASI